MHTLHRLGTHLVGMGRDGVSIQGRKAFELAHLGRRLLLLPRTTGCQCQQANQRNDIKQTLRHLMVTIVAPNPYS